MFIEVEKGITINTDRVYSIEVFAHYARQPWEQEWSLRISSGNDVHYLFKSRERQKVVDEYNKLLEKISINYTLNREEN